MNSLTEISTLYGHTDRAWHVAWSPNGKYLTSCGGDKTVRLWAQDNKNNSNNNNKSKSEEDTSNNNNNDKNTCKWISKGIIVSEHHKRTIRRTDWNYDSTLLAVASFDSQTSIWEFSDSGCELLTILEGHVNEVKAASWNAAGNLLATCSRDKTVWIWEKEDDDFECVALLDDHTQDVKNVVWHPQKDELISCSYDDKIISWTDDTEEGEWSANQEMPAHNSTVWDASFNCDGSLFASCSSDKTLRIWKYFASEKKWRNVCTVADEHTRYIYSVSWSKTSSNLIATACGDDAIRIFTIDTEAMTSKDEIVLKMLCCKKKAHGSDVNCVSWHPTNSNLLASCSDEGIVKIWKFQF